MGGPRGCLVTAVAKLRPRKVLTRLVHHIRDDAWPARCIEHLNGGIKQLDAELTELVADTAPSPVELFGVGTGSNPAPATKKALCIPTSPEGLLILASDPCC